MTAIASCAARSPSSSSARRLSESSPTTSEEEPRFATITPPTRFDATTAAELARHLDWAEFHEHLLARALGRMAHALKRAGLDGVPTTHNLPLAQETTPLNAERVSRVVDLVGLDYYHKATPSSRVTIARRTSELAVRCEAHDVVAFACELGAGFPPFFPPLSEQDSAFTALAALAYGLRGFNLYMAVERDRWIGAPIDRHGRVRPFASFWKKLLAALERTRFHTLRRRVPVRILTPRSQRRLSRVMHAFGPLTSSFFSVLGGGARESCSEEELDLGYPVAIEADGFARAFEQALEARGVPFAHVGGEERAASLDGARWIVCATSGGVHPALLRALEQAAAEGVRVTLGPRPPLYDGAMRLQSSPVPLSSRGLVLLDSDAPAAVDAAVAGAIDQLGLPTYACDPDSVLATVHEDASGRAAVLFLLNPSGDDVLARVTVGSGVASAVDLLDDARVEQRRGALELRMRPRTVRMLALTRSA